MKVLVAAITFVLLSAPVRAQQDPSVDDVLARVNNAMRTVLGTMPEFVCTETITSSVWDKGKLKEERRVESTLSFVRDPKAIAGMREVREITAIDGKAAGATSKLPKLPVSEGFAISVLFARFINPHPEAKHRLAGVEDLSGLATVAEGSAAGRIMRIEFASPPPRGNSRTVSTVGGTMLIDAETMRLIEIEQHSADRDLVVSGDFQSVQIGESEHWLPRSVTLETRGSLPGALFKKNTASRHSADFSGCRKFDVSVRMLPLTR